VVSVIGKILKLTFELNEINDTMALLRGAGIA
jgi:hypothetical protein